MIDRCFCTTLRRAAAASTAHYDTTLKPSGLSVTMFRLLRRISEAGTPTISELADIVGLDRSTLGRNLRVLEKQTLVKMARGLDARSQQISLTKKGSLALETALPLWREAQENFSELIPSETLDALMQLADGTHHHVIDNGNAS